MFMEQEVGSKELASPVELLTQAWTVTKARFWPLLVCNLIPFLYGFLLMLLIVGPVFLTGSLSVGGGFELGSLFSPFMVIGFILGVIMLVIISLWQGVAVIELISGAEEKLSLATAFKKAWPKIWGALGVAITSGVIMFGAAFPLIIPAMVVGTWFAFGQYVFIVEGTGGLKALRISREYVRGKFWAVVGRLLFVMLLFIGLALVQGIFNLVLGDELFGKISWIFSLINLPVTILVAVYQFLLYKNLKEVRGGAINPADVEGGKTKWILLAIWGVLGWLIIPIAMAILLVAINPKKQLDQARNTNTQFNRQIITRELDQYFNVNMVYPQNIDELIPDYLSEQFSYQLSSDGRDYELCDASNDCTTSKGVSEGTD